MLDLLLHILGKDTSQIPPGADVEFTFRHAPESWMVFVLIAVMGALLYGIWWFYRNENDNCSRTIKSVLAVVRSTVLLLAVLIFLAPAISYSTRRIIKPYVMVLLDNSLSMTIEDQYRDSSRIETIASATGLRAADFGDSPPSRAFILDKILSHNRNEFIRSLRQRGHVRVMSFSDHVQMRATLGAQQPEQLRQLMADDDGDSDAPVEDRIPPLTPKGEATDIAGTIQKARRLGGDKPIAGMILLSDGQNNTGRDPGAAASRAGAQQIPIFTAGLGNPNDPVNIRLVDLWAPENVFQNDPLTLKASIQTRGMKKTTAQLTLRRRRVGQSDGKKEGTLIGRKNISLRRGLHTIKLKHTPKRSGKFIFSVVLQTPEKELLTSDNSGSTMVSVLDKQVRVLLISGAPNWNYRMVKNLLLRDKTVNLSCWMQTMSTRMRQAGDTVIDHLPRSREELFNYDAVLLFDPNPVEIGKKWIKKLKNFMDKRGGGVMWMAGPLHTFDFLTGASTSGIRDLLPVRFAGMQSNVLSSLGNTFPREWPLKVPPAATDHPLLQIDPDTSGASAFWESLPGTYWSFPASAPKPGGQVLLEHTNPALSSSNQRRPLLVAGRYGSGHSLYMGFRSAWRWRRADEGYFERFWIQAIRYLTRGRLTKGRNRGRILTNRGTYAVGDNVVIRARLYDSNFTPLKRDRVTVKLDAPNSKTVKISLRKIPNTRGKYEGALTATTTGLNRLSIHLNSGSGEQVTINQQFRVKMPKAELNDPRMNKALLEEIADRSGGQFVPLDELPNVYQNMPDRKKTTIVHGRPVPLWDTNRMLVLIVVLLSLEWALRKRSGLM